ncbi:MAG: four helix bundle protein [Gemmatimonadales bacterium]
MRDHRSLIAWQLSRTVARAILGLSRKYWKPHAAAVFQQMQRASLSIQLNVAEGYALKSSARFRNHLEIAYGSAVETGELLELAADENVVPVEVVTPVLGDCRRTQRLLLGLIKRYRTR